MAMRITLQFFLLPVLVLVLPLMYLLAWLHEAVGDLMPRQTPALLPGRSRVD